MFISYDRNDQAVAEQVRARLVAAGVKTWMDRYNIPAGAYWPDEIDVGLDQSTMVVGILSPDAVTSRNVKNEWDWAIQNEKPLVLLRIRPGVIPHRYVSINFIDATKNGLESALDELVRVSGPRSTPSVFTAPETQYVRSGELRIAYHVFGMGGVDLVYLPGSLSHIEHSWRLPAMAAFLRRLASFTRVVLHDVRGTGMSERPARVSTLEERMDDLQAVMDACKSERAVVLGVSEGVALSILFAATYPRRTSALILYGGRAAHVRQDDYPWAEQLETLRRRVETEIETIADGWGSKQSARKIVQKAALSAQDDEELVTWLAALQRLGTSPDAEIERQRMNLEVDVRCILPVVRARTLVLHRTVDLVANIGEGRYIADHIPGAMFEELPGVDHFVMVGDQAPVFAAIERFVRASPDVEPEGNEEGTALATVVWIETDGLAAAELLNVTTPALEKFRGRIDSRSSNGIAAIFDGAARAIRFADAVSDELTTRGATVRSGLQTGALTTEETELTGSPLQDARRLARLAPPGQILVAGAIRGLVAGSGMRFESVPLGNSDSAPDSVEILQVDRDSLA